MRKKLRKTSAFVCAIAVMAAPMTFSSFVANADGETVTSDYTLTIPATLAVANSGWNSIGNLTATGTLAQGKKLNVTATSENSWKLTSGENTVAYKLCGETEKEKTYADATDTTSLDISKELLEQTSGFSVPIGIVVEDYSDKPAGDYSDTVTFTAKVENAVVTPKTYPSLKTGDILHVGDIVTSADSTSGYSFKNYWCSFPKNKSFKLVRADISISGYAKVTESDTGAYYVFLNLSEDEESEYRYFCLGGVEEQGELDDMTGKVIFKATETSDGLEVTVDDKQKISFSVHES